ncbi:MAG: AAA family ATPase [bacterium]|jgi:predicted ATPase|nr:AAA family ATPase [bacterium]
MHLKRVRIFPDKFPTQAHYPFSLDVMQQTEELVFSTPVTFFVGENGTGKSTLLRAICQRCGIHIWQNREGARVKRNPFENLLFTALGIEWANGSVPGSYFGSDIFEQFARIVEEWASTDPAQLQYFGGRSLLSQSHGQSLMAYFTSRYQIEGLYFLDEPETALSPRTQIQLLQLLRAMSEAGHAQFLVATHSPLLLACPGATIYSFDSTPVSPIPYHDTMHYQVYKQFMENPGSFV